MNRVAGIVLLACLSWFGSGCVYIGPSSFIPDYGKVPPVEEMASDTKDFRLPALPEEGKALVYVVRPKAILMQGLANRLFSVRVYLDEKKADAEQGSTGEGQYIYFPVSPGIHHVLSRSGNVADIVVDAKAGDVVFIKQLLKRTFLGIGTSLSVVDPVEGAYHIMRTSPGSMIVRKEQEQE
jgi:hypothetical protein